jgi:uncharacterized membrane protein (UPF0127 family)
MNLRYLGRLICLIILLAAAPSQATNATICGFPVMGSLAIMRHGALVTQFEVTLSQTPAQHRQGLMHCPALTPGSGMLFTYPDAQRRSFWMKNTRIELAIVYITADCRIAAIERGEPATTTSIPSPEGVQFVLEINYAEASPLALGDEVRLRSTAPLRPPGLDCRTP